MPWNEWSNKNALLCMVALLWKNKSRHKQFSKSRPRDYFCRKSIDRYIFCYAWKAEYTVFCTVTAACIILTCDMLFHG